MYRPPLRHVLPHMATGVDIGPRLRDSGDIGLIAAASARRSTEPLFSGRGPRDRVDRRPSRRYARAVAAVRDSGLPARHAEGMILANNDDSEATCPRSRRVSLRMRLCLMPTSNKPSSVNSRPWRPSKLSVVRPVVGWRNGLDPSV